MTSVGSATGATGLGRNQIPDPGCLRGAEAVNLHQSLRVGHHRTFDRAEGNYFDELLERIRDIIRISDREILTHAGKISPETARTRPSPGRRSSSRAS